MAPQSATADGRLFFLKIDRLAVILRPVLNPIGGILDSVLGTNPLGGKIVSVNPDGTGRQIVLGGLNSIPDGIQVDVEGGHIYWTNMGRPDLNDGSIQRVDLDGRNIATIVREGMRAMRIWMAPTSKLLSREAAAKRIAETRRTGAWA
jgi:hypothetical protein